MAIPAAAGPLPAPAYGPVHAALVYVGVATLVAVAIYVRVFEIDRVPFGLHGGEDMARASALRIVDQDWLGPWSLVAGGQPTGFVYWLSTWAHLSADDPIVLRMSAVTIGLATIAVFYLFCRRLFGGGAAFFGAVLLAFSQWHLLYSSVALPVISLPLLEMIVAAILYHALEGDHGEARRRGLLVLAGITFGMGVYTTNAFFVFALAIALLWVREFLIGDHKADDVFRRCMAFFVPALAAALPYLLYFASHASAMLEQARSVMFTRAPEFQALSGVAEQTRHVVADIGAALGMLLWSRNLGEASSLAGDRLVDPLTAGLAMVGLAVALSRIGERRYLFVWLVIACAVVAGGLTTEAGLQERAVVALPAVFASAGFGLHWLLGWTKGRLSAVAVTTMVAIALASAVAYNLAVHLGDRV